MEIACHKANHVLVKTLILGTAKIEAIHRIFYGFTDVIKPRKMVRKTQEAACKLTHFQLVIYKLGKCPSNMTKWFTVPVNT